MSCNARYASREVWCLLCCCVGEVYCPYALSSQSLDVSRGSPLCLCTCRILNNNKLNGSLSGLRSSSFPQMQFLDLSNNAFSELPAMLPASQETLQASAYWTRLASCSRTERF